MEKLDAKIVEIKCGRDIFFNGYRNSRDINVEILDGLECDCSYKTRKGNCKLVEGKRKYRPCYYSTSNIADI